MCLAGYLLLQPHWDFSQTAATKPVNQTLKGTSLSINQYKYGLRDGHTLTLHDDSLNTSERGAF